MTTTNTITAGSQVRMRPEWCSRPEEREMLYVVVGEPSYDGRILISPVEWPYGIAPQELVAPDMVEPAFPADLTGCTDEQLLKLLEAAQSIQKRNPPTSAAWREASGEIHRLAAENARRYGPTSRQEV